MIVVTIVLKGSCWESTLLRSVLILVGVASSSALLEYQGMNHRYSVPKPRNCWMLKRLFNLRFARLYVFYKFCTILSLSRTIAYPDVDACSPWYLPSLIWSWHFSVVRHNPVPRTYLITVLMCPICSWLTVQYIRIVFPYSCQMWTSSSQMVVLIYMSNSVIAYYVWTCITMGKYWP